MMVQVLADMAGTVYQVLVSVGDAVQDGQDVVVLESMKMEVPIASTVAGSVVKVLVQPGDFVNEGQALVEIE
ncbi:acetyl-CoA carboxylase biotin carboxyl carrier protein subunit [Alicyclobacillus dauci]|uniref:Acetyl-CoA carboxylase biotin carboxyl carrier protein subunit n=1 Tax=Alicyclobacillus dauci TaxID=1475485 RepID=A0ABY6Z863_9BACL|nr:acetyl-CoA carboxylase biotin carboxyl carrier protein subunit [Alicyclobacillus dauci]WAH38718.1 acetyl-CoA carboxylase biotin carboxyl carrier protein subunit [Alicyclobacillus dauci]